MTFKKLKAVRGCPAIKELFVEFQACAGKHLVIEHFRAEPKQTKVVCAKTSDLFLVSSTPAFECTISRHCTGGAP